MKIQFIGVGEAFDPQYSNSSFLVHSDTKLLIDCGYAVPHNLFALKLESNFIDAIYITHFHADHFFGLAPLLLRLREDGRTKPLVVIGQSGIAGVVERLVEFAYPGNFSKLRFALEFRELTFPLMLNELTLTFAETIHSVRNYAVRLEGPQCSAAFSGDGGITDASRQLFSKCDMVIHEAYSLDSHRDGHTSALELMDVLQQLPDLKLLALVHLERHAREQQFQSFVGLDGRYHFRVRIPLPGDVLDCES